MVTKKTKGYSKVKTDFFKLLFMDPKSMLKDPKEPLDKWIIRKTEGK